jgi:Domain of unknown function (DUF4129)/Transglutaminase-like superfamily
VGVILFIVATIASFYWLNKFYRSLSNDLPAGTSRRRVILIDNLQSTDREIPLVIPAAETQVSAKLAPASSLPIIRPAPQKRDRSPNVLPSFKIDRSPIEESLLFRSLVLGMFALSIISVDLAAGTHYSVIGIPFTIAGAAWSWYRRHYAKHWLNLTTSIASLVILMGLLVPILVKEMQMGIDRYPLPAAAPATKISVAISIGLGMLLVSLQMGLSFHLYSRKVLGYCLVISGLLMGIAANLSQSLSFLILLSGVMAISVPALMLDYRSRLALPPIGITAVPTRHHLPYQHLPWQYLGRLTIISIGLGLMLAVFLPNFHLPNLSIHPTGLNDIKTLSQKYQPPQLDPQSPSPQPSGTPQPQLTTQELATKALGQPDNNNYPDLIKQDNLQLPPELAKELHQFTHKILATSPQPLKSDFDRATYIAEYLKQHHRDDPQPVSAADVKLFQQFITNCAATPKTCQLTGNKRDLPLVYATMLRSIGIPARVKIDDQLAKIDPQTKLYSIPPDQSQSHSEVYFPNWGWLDLDSTPDRPLLNLNTRQLDQLKDIAFAEHPPAQATSSPTPNSSIESSPTTGEHKPNTVTPYSSNSPLPILPTDPVVLRIIVAAIALCLTISWYLWHQHQKQQQLAKLPPVEQIYRSMVATLNKQGLVKHPAQTQLEYATSANQIYPPAIAKVVWEISQIYTAWRYGKQRIDVKQLAKKLHHLQQLQQLAAKK